MRYTTSLGDIKGVGAKTALQLQIAGLNTVLDLITFLPRTYEDYSEVASIRDIQPGNVVLKGTFTDISSRHVRRGLHITTAALSDTSGKVYVTWFNQPYRAKHLAAGTEYVVAGEFTFSQRRYQILNPSVSSSDEILTGGEKIVPIYRQVSGLKTAQVRKIIEEIRPLITMLPEFLPDELIRREKLLSYADAMLALHFPESAQDIADGRKRLEFQEILELLYAAELNKADNASLQSWHIPFDVTDAKTFVASLPFKLTDSQRKAAWDVVQNFGSNAPMNRLLQGDVGSGKTVVAGMSAYMAARAGFQSAIMAPTELLARQHARTLADLLEPLGVSVALLTGAVKKKQKHILKEQILNGSVAIVVGTHALIQDDVRFHKLGFVVIDEQHRFGVNQRQKLLEKSEKMPHMLSMTATPIPRSLQLTVYGELEISLLREKPSGRKPILTKIHSPNSRTDLYRQVDEEIEKGRQVYVVCPLIQDGELTSGGADDMELKSVETETKRLRKSVFKHRTIGVLHGKLSSDEKKSVMEDFLAHKIDILVSTTVVEVGVDVSNATVMIIEGADHFGLAQLHQLRGRVGRSDQQSYCYLVPSDSRKPSERLRELEKSNDGFYLAERDLELRGPGEIYGKMQHGQLNLQVANLADTLLLKKVQDALLWIRENNINLLQYEGMKHRVNKYRRLTTLN